MFLIVPKSKNNTLRVSQPVARLKGAARVHAACSRCRLKKVKCDNRMPCIRCAQDGVLCVETKKAPADAKAASIEYIRKMEDQQSQLLKALTAVSKHVRQPVDGEDLKEILDIVEKGGFAFETVGEHPTIARTTTSNVRNKRRNDDQVDEGDSISPTRKRKQGCGKGVSPLGNGNPHSTSANISTSFDQNIPPHYQPTPESIDNYWKMDGYGDKVAAPFKHPLTDTYPAISPSTQQNRIAPSQDIWVPGNRICDSISQSTYPTAPTTCPPVAGLDLIQDTEPLFSSLNHFDSTDWNSVLWWDPSLLFEPKFDAESQGSNASEFPNTL